MSKTVGFQFSITSRYKHVTFLSDDRISEKSNHRIFRWCQSGKPSCALYLSLPLANAGVGFVDLWNAPMQVGHVCCGPTQCGTKSGFSEKFSRPAPCEDREYRCKLSGCRLGHELCPLSSERLLYYTDFHFESDKMVLPTVLLKVMLVSVFSH